MERIIGFVDYGFLNKSACGPLRAKKLKPKAAGVVDWLRSIENGDPNSFLRAYWYDGAFDARDARHGRQRKYFDSIAAVPGVQLRLGHLQETKPKWQYAVREAMRKAELDISKFEEHFEFRSELGQKGVDTRIALDLVRLAQRHAYDVGILVAGDRDLAEPVRLAQDEGRRIIVAAPEHASVAIELKQLADQMIDLTPDLLHAMFDRDAADSTATATRAASVNLAPDSKS
jgi:uncharacterized LabA/DUF88 family protein